jgi:hypothetical protein
MNPKEYEKNVLITESCDFDAIRNRCDDKMIRLLHAGLGLSSELAELELALNKPAIDWVNVYEEASDLMWYSAVASNTLGLDFEDVCSLEEKEFKDHLVKDAVISTVWATGEFNDLIKKHLFYGREFNFDKATKLLKQLCMAISGICVCAGKTPDEVREVNIAKLKSRYGQKFTEAAALNRDLETERKILEGEIV